MNTILLDIYVTNKLKLIKTVEKMNRKCEKLNLEQITTVWGDEYIAKREVEGKIYHYEKQIVTISFPEIKLSEEWELIGKIDILTENINFVFSIGSDDLKEYSNKPCQCEHCNKNMSRNKVFVIKNTDNKKMMVGSTCLADFLGHDVLSKLQLAEMREQFQSFGHLSDSDKPLDGMTLSLFVDVTIGAIFSTKGRFYSKKNLEQNDGYATIFSVEDWYMCFQKGATPESYPFQFEKCEVDLYTNNILEELTLLSEKSDMSSFEMNVVNCFKIGFVPYKMFSSVVGYVGLWWIKNEIAKEPSDFNPKLSEYIGKEGEKFEAIVVVDKVIASNSDYGGVIIFGHVVGTNNKFAWYTTSSNNLYTYNNNVLKTVDGEFKIRATIKNLKPDDKFGNTTWITRAKVL